jgi:murein DD-endopeptidase MepM/ murein hydrolase activator NlpD
LSARVALALGLLAVAALGAGAGAAVEPAATTAASARSLAIRIVVPGTNGAGTAPVAAPPTASAVAAGSFAYPETGSVVSAASTSASATAEENGSVALATGAVTGLVIFDGEITADSVLARAAAAASESSAGGDFDGTIVQNLQVFGAAPTGTAIALADWGTLTLYSSGAEPNTAKGFTRYSGSVIALDIRLTADHGGLPAGSEIQIGYAEVVAQSVPAPAEPETTTEQASGPRPSAEREPEPEPVPAPTPTPETATGPTETGPAPPEPEPDATTAKGPSGPAGHVPDPGPPRWLFPLPEELSPPLEGGPYLFPVFGSSSYIDTYGEFRGDVSYHHGADIFGELGQPLVAIADGTTFSVGRNKLGGNRLWLRDKQGNAFYYAHLSAFSTLVFNGAHVKAGQVVGFMGNTGDADATPVHLHFEVHPVSLLYLGYDGAVDPNPYLDEWRHLQRLPYPVPPGWAPNVYGGNAAPRPGAVLLAVSDISSADGLDPDSLRRAIEVPQARP